MPTCAGSKKMKGRVVVVKEEEKRKKKKMNNVNKNENEI